MSNNKLSIGLVVVAVIAIIGIIFPVYKAPEVKEGSTSTTNLSSLGLATLEVGSGCDTQYGTCTGTPLTHFIPTTCNLIGTDASQAASSSKAYDCAVTNVTSADRVIAQLATSTPGVGGVGPWAIDASKASTTAGFVTIILHNYGGAAQPSLTSVGSSTRIIAY